jgi:hypothetical protein
MRQTEAYRRIAVLVALIGGCLAVTASVSRAQTPGALIADPLSAEVRRLPPIPRKPITSRSEVIESAKKAAADHALPANFFLRLIRQESGFNRNSVSRAGAMGIAQFMPATAHERGLKNPFDPKEALPKSAELLQDLWSEFGNLGLAAAAYNAGRGRVSHWLSGHSSLPLETREYVKAVTGRWPDAWARSAGHAVPPFAIGSTSAERSAKAREVWELALIPADVRNLLPYSAGMSQRHARRLSQKHAAYRIRSRSEKLMYEADLCLACISKHAY